MAVVALIDAPFVGIAAIRVKDVNLAKLLVRVYAHAVVVGGVHDLLREGVILLHCACFSIVMVPSRGFSYSLTPKMTPKMITHDDQNVRTLLGKRKRGDRAKNREDFHLDFTGALLIFWGVTFGSDCDQLSVRNTEVGKPSLLIRFAPSGLAAQA